MTQGTQALPEDVELERMVAQMVQYMLVAEQRKLPVKKVLPFILLSLQESATTVIIPLCLADQSELVKALQLRGSTSKTFKTVVAEAGQLLTNLFGYRFVTQSMVLSHGTIGVERRSGCRLHELDERAGSFVLVNTVRLGRRDAACERQQRRDTILFLVLAAVHLAGGHLPEGCPVPPVPSGLVLWVATHSLGTTALPPPPPPPPPQPSRTLSPVMTS